MIDTDALMAFLAVAESGSTHGAARTLNLSQAAVSRRLSRLEAALGVSLFVRGGHTLRLSAAGAQLLPEARLHVDGLSNALARARSIGVQSTTTVTLGCLATLSLHVLPSILSQFARQKPEVRVCVLDLSPLAIEESVANGASDFALTMLGIGVPQLSHEVLAEEPLVLVCPTGHGLASRKRLEWSDLAGLPLIGIGPHSANQRLLDSARSSVGVHLDWQHEVQRATTAVELVAAGIGLAVLPWTPELAHRADLRMVRLDNPLIHRRIGILRRSGERLSKPAETLRRLISSALKRRSGGP